MREWKDFFFSEESQDILHDLFWWFFLKKLVNLKYQRMCISMVRLVNLAGPFLKAYKKGVFLLEIFGFDKIPSVVIIH